MNQSGRSQHFWLLTRVLILVLALLLASLLLVACGDEDDDAAPVDTPTPEALNADFRLGLVTNVGGSIDDGGFSESAHMGALRAQAAFNLDYDYGISRDENDYRIQLDQHIAENRNIIVTVGFPMEAITLEYALNNPDIYFIGVDQGFGGTDELPPNLIGLQFAEDEAAFMVGALAGRMTESNVVGVVAGMESVPPVVRLAEGFRNGAQYVNPDVDVRITYINSFDDAELAIAAADAFLAADADVIFGAAGLAGSIGIQHAARQGAWVIGVDQDEWRTNWVEGQGEGSDRVLSSAMKGIENTVFQAIESILTSDDPITGVVRFNTAQCGVGFAPFHEAEGSIPQETQDLVEDIWRALAAGTLHTGAAEPGQTPPEPLGDEAGPLVPDDAPRPDDCIG